MAQSIRQQIIDAIAKRLALISTGYQFDLPDGPYVCQSNILGVYPWRKVPFSPVQVPAIAYWDTRSDVSPGPSGQHEHNLSIGMEIYTTGAASASSARSLLSDVVAAIGSDVRWGRLAHWTDLTAHSLVVEQSGDIVAAAQVNFSVTYRTPLWRI